MILSCTKLNQLRFIRLVCIINSNSTTEEEEGCTIISNSNSKYSSSSSSSNFNSSSSKWCCHLQCTTQPKTLCNSSVRGPISKSPLAAPISRPPLRPSSTSTLRRRSTRTTTRTRPTTARSSRNCPPRRWPPGARPISSKFSSSNKTQGLSKSSNLEVIWTGWRCRRPLLEIRALSWITRKGIWGDSSSSSSLFSNNILMKKLNLKYLRWASVLMEEDLCDELLLQAKDDSSKIQTWLGSWIEWKIWR